MKVWHKMLVAPLVAILFLLALGAISVTLMARQGVAIGTLVKNRGGSMELALAAFQVTGQVQTSAWRSLNQWESMGEEAVKAAAVEQQQLLEAFEKKSAEFATRPQLEPEERALVEAALGHLAQYRKALDGAMSQVFGSPYAGKFAMEGADASYQELVKTFTALAELQAQLAAQSAKRGAADFRNMLVSLLGIAVAAAATALAVAILMGRGVVRPMRAAIAAADGIARGDLSSAIQVRGRDETAELLRAQARMKEDLRQLVGDVAAGARSVADTSSQIAQGNLDLSQRTEMQASTLEETASSMEQLTSTVQQNANHARQASRLAVDASGVARKGGEVVGQVVETMAGISASSKKIGDIIGVIDGIAFQTNILALNAAVEAARAGEQGRGFAVVAAEVRSLAQRSAAAAREIKALIVESVGQVDAGAKLVETAGRTMQEIVGSVNKVSDLIAGIASASEDQSAGIAQVNTAMAQMDQVVQQNASLVEEASAATESMKAQAAALLQSVSRFQLEGSPSPLDNMRTNRWARWNDLPSSQIEGAAA